MSCSVSTCKSKWTKDVNRKYHRFPREQRFREKWAHAIGMTRKPTDNSTICSDHFRVSDYRLTTNHGKIPGQLRKGIIPSLNLPDSNSLSNSADVATNCFSTLKRKQTTFTIPVKIPVEFVAIKSEPTIDSEEVTAQSAKKMKSETIVTTSDKLTMVKRSVETQTSFINMRVSYNTISDSELIYATGFERSKFNLISDTLEQYSPIPENTVCIKRDLLLVTLFMLRHQENMKTKMVEFIFGISRKIISTVCKDLVDKLFCLLQRKDIWKGPFRESKPFSCLIENIEKYRSQKK